MKKYCAAVLGVLLVLGFAASAFAIHAEIPSETQAIVAKGATEITIGGDIRFRGEYRKHYATAGLLHDKGVKLGDEVFTSKGTVGSTANEVDYAVDALVRFDGDNKKALNLLSGGGMHINATEWIRKNIQTDKAEIEKAEGPIYNVTLHKGKQPGEYDYLKWDEPPSKQNLNKIALRAARDLSPELQKEIALTIDKIKGSFKPLKVNSKIASLHFPKY